MYYGVITLSVLMFGINFWMNNRYQRHSGSGLSATFFFTLCGNLAGLPILLALNGFRMGATPFTLMMAAVAAINSVAYSFCALKAFAHINLSLYSIFSMLGGMVLPFLFGIVVYREPLTLANTLCLLLIAAALALTVKPGERKKGGIYYAGVFCLNGLSGVLSKLFQSAPFQKTDAASYSVWIAVWCVVLSAAVLTATRAWRLLPCKAALGYAFGCGVLNRTANYLLLVALAVLPASVQYPFVTGGTMIVCAVISALTGQRPSRREVLAIALSFAGILLLVLL